MGQKIHPISLRLQKTNRFYQSAWFSNLYYTSFLQKDFFFKRIGKKFICESKYLSPKLFGSSRKGQWDLFVFFLTKKKQFKKFQFRFRSRKKNSGELQKNKNSQKVFCGKARENHPYKKIKNENLFWDTLFFSKLENFKKKHFKRYLLNKIKSEKTSTKPFQSISY